MPGSPRGPTLRARLPYDLIGSAVAAYLVARAVLVPLTYDEAATFARYIDTGVTSVFDFNVATNHFLNTCLTWLSSRVFGGAPWALRLPSLVAGIAFIVYAAAIGRRAASPVVGFAGFVLMVSNPYVLDYLALSRGYGLALCLVTASVYNLLSWWDRPSGTGEARRRLARIVWLAAGAVLATFTTLPAFLAVLAVVTARLVWTARYRQPHAVETVIPSAGWKFLAGWLLLAAGFSLMVFSRHAVLSPELFTPIVVRTVGLFEGENDQIQVFRLDSTGRVRPFERDGLGIWRSDVARSAWGLRIELPGSVDRNLTSLEVTIGTQAFRRDRHDGGPWTVWDAGTQRTLRSTAALSAPRSRIGTVAGSINWGGDEGQWRLGAGYTAILVALLAIGAAALSVAASWAVGAGALAYAEARLLVSALLGVAGLVAAPLYLLRRDAQLYFGGSSGLVTDTIGSLLHRTAYGAVYSPNQVQLGLASLALLAAALVLAWILAPRHRATLAGSVVVLAVVALSALEVVAQHALLGTPWLTGRTALFLLPLLLTFVAVSADGLARFGPLARIIVASVMALIASASVWHALSVVNVERTLDWPDDAATPAMLREVAARVDRSAPRTVRVGVDWMFYSSARYYARRMSDATTTYEVEVVPGDGDPPHFFYTAEHLDPAVASRIGGFDKSPAILWQSRRPTGSR